MRFLRRRTPDPGAAPPEPKPAPVGRATPAPEEYAGRGRGRTVLLITDVAQTDVVKRWLDLFSDDDVYVLSVEEAPEWHLAERGAHYREWNGSPASKAHRMPALDVVVDLVSKAGLPGTSTRLGVFNGVFRTVKRDGLYLVDRRAVGEAAPETDELLRLLAVSGDAQLGEGSELERSVGDVLLTREMVAVTKRSEHFYKLRDERNTDRILAMREPDVTVTSLDRRPAGRLAIAAPVVHHGGGNEPDLDAIAYPQLECRHYEGPIALGGRMLLWTGHTVLPDSFRWHLGKQLHNPNLRNVGGPWGRIDSRYLPKRSLEGSYYVLDSVHTGHFGHLTTEVVSRLWGWDAAKQAVPDLKVLFVQLPGRRTGAALEKAFFGAYGIAADDVVWSEGPVEIRSAVASTPMWHNAQPHYVHPGIQETWDRLADGFLRGADVGSDVPEKIFVSRGEGARNRVCRNQPEVEAFFAERGYAVVVPERLSLPDQVHLFRGAKVIAGFAGSAMFNLMYSHNAEKVVVLGHEAYIARNELLYAAMLGVEAHFFWSAPDNVPAEGRFDYAAYQGSWAFDFEQHAAELDRQLR
ncbi:glycosyltransferase family 61 protein [Nocardioides cheoyonin]|uniref:glycosyltransferase family 61 protein n=1 Tax=Nocardioides cheoyonin TaxID=3156615 RepID=UPI0032B61C88